MHFLTPTPSFLILSDWNVFNSLCTRLLREPLLIPQGPTWIFLFVYEVLLKYLVPTPITLVRNHCHLPHAFKAHWWFFFLLYSTYHMILTGFRTHYHPNVALWNIEYFKLKECEKRTSARTLWPSPETAGKTLTWVVPFLYLEKRSILISKTRGL